MIRHDAFGTSKAAIVAKKKVDKRLAKAFGRALKDVRERVEATQEELAEAVDVHRTYVGFLETGRRQPSLKIVFDMARGLGVRPTVLVDQVERHYYRVDERDDLLEAAEFNHKYGEPQK